jgi:glutamate-1-semialdehyde 2,1-aminomutase
MTCDTKLFGKYFHQMLKQGIYLPPSQFEANFISAAHSEEDIKKTIAANKKALQEIHP